MAGMYQLYRLRELGLRALVLEAGGNVGGTWYWNRYPGARFDSESYSYGYSFSKELLQEWEWSEHFSAQPETLRYVNHVADRFDLRRDMRFNSRVIKAERDDANNRWHVLTADGFRAQATFLVTAIGALSAPTLPDIPGRAQFAGQAFHTAHWPHEPVSFEGKRVAVIGTGATGVQVIQEVAKSAGTLTVFQRRPNFCAPLHNAPIDAETQAKIKASYDDIFARCRESHGSFLHNADPREALAVSAEEREAFFEQLYAEPGFRKWMGNFRDLMVVPEANALITDFMARKIRERVSDPQVAEKLIPTDHGFGTRRVPLETGYYEVYNQDNVRLVDLNETPIEAVTELGIRTSQEELPFDLIIYATGFDAVTGPFDRMDIRAGDGRRLRDVWEEGPRTFLGMFVAGFENLMTLVGPTNAATFCNIPRCIEQNVEWVSDLLAHMQRAGLDRVDALPAAQEEWSAHVQETADRMLFSKVDSWFMGINSNLAHKTRRVPLVYAGGTPAYRERCDAIAAGGYRELRLR